MTISQWSTTAASNASIIDASYGNINYQENQNPNTVNDSARAEMAHVRAFYETLEWRDLGHTVVRTGNTTFTIASVADLSGYYVVGRRIRGIDSSTLYGTISASSHAASTQTVTVLLDSGNLSASLTAVALGFNMANAPFIAHIRGFMAYLTTDRTLTTGVAGDIIFDTENYDTEGAYNPSTGVFTVPAWATKMQVSVNLDYAANATGRRQAFLTQGSGATSLPKPFWSTPSGGAAGPTNVGGTSGWINVVAASTYIVTGFQDSGGNLAVTGSTNHRSYLSVLFAP